MALFGGARAADFVNKINREVIVDVIDTEVEYYILSLNETETNLYDESINKVYYSPVRIPVLYSRDDQIFAGDEYGQDYSQAAIFGFIRDVLIDVDLVPKVGDIIKWDSDHFDIDGLVENTYFLGKKPETWFGGNTHGFSVSILAQAHKTRDSKLNLVNTRGGITPTPDKGLNKDYL